MKLGFYYHIPAVQENGQILVPGYLGRFLDVLAEHFEGLTLFQHVPNPGENVHFDYDIQSKNVTLVSLPPRRSVPYRMLHPGEFTSVILDHLENLDGLLLRGPTPLLPVNTKAVKPLPTILLLVGDYLAGVDSLPQPWWRKELIRLWSLHNQRQELKAARDSLVFVNSQVLYQNYQGKIRNLQQTRTTTLSQDDFFKREDTCQGRPIHLLYTGRMDPAKGLLDMVQALSILVKAGEDLVLDLVGWHEAGSDILSQIEKTAVQGGVGDRVFYHGYKAVGPELFAYYKKADIYIIASQSSFEGFPRTIWEAMAHSTPVVATWVGAIPDFVEGVAELVPPKDPDALAMGIKHLIEDKSLRKAYIRKGFALANQNTLEVQVGEMSQAIHSWVGGKHG